MTDKQKQFHDAVALDRKKETELERLLANPSLCKMLDIFLGNPKIAPMTFFLLMGCLILGFFLFDRFLPSIDTYYLLGWGVAFSVTMFLYNSYATLAVSLCLSGVYILVEHSTQPLLCLTGVMSIVLGTLSIWRYLKWFDTRKGQPSAPPNSHSPSAQGADGR